ncbi:hypothetical protein [Azohydromonas caseinilytica]|uniref:Cysteine rich repeat-containing protein n=1 Tax=Azohydromonas caseinilytica TaxID=2728836 RepID=A0A848FGI4_9BURK|nr:hypothetical protein [Azohydromonas caseinilytica]NML17965.1 hypothetical protein [Azohydromonas caseinilytica]
MRAFLILTLASMGCAAVVSAADTARATYERERAACLSGQSGQDRGTCLREAAAAYQEARSGRRGAATSDGTDRYAQNARLRCQPLPPADRAECEARISSGTTSGSVSGGGILREHRSVQPLEPASTNAESQPTPSPQTSPAPASAPQ